MRLAELLKEGIFLHDPKAKLPVDLEPWSKEIERLMRIDKRDEKEIEAVIRWSHADPFWHKNILSADKLREKFSQLFINMKSDKNGNGISSQPVINWAVIVRDLKNKIIKSYDPWHTKKQAEEQRVAVENDPGFDFVNHRAYIEPTKLPVKETAIK
jgi:phosphoenolpyruvate synthase/pyruvate phosphate dikinase